MEIVHIIGNGPSKQFFVNEPKGIVYGCNYGEPAITEMEKVFIHDTRVFRNIEIEAVQFPYDIITRLPFKPYIDKLRRCGYIKNAPTFLPKTIREKSTGHDALHFFAGNRAVKEIHLWGFDSIHKQDMTSDSKDKIRGSAQITKLLPIWLDRFKRLCLCCRRLGKKVIIHRDAETCFTL